MNRFDDYVRQLAREEHFELPLDYNNTLALICENLPETPIPGAGRKKTKRLGFMLLAAVLLFGLTATAMANFRVGEWFERYFGTKTSGDLSQAQVSVIEAKTTDVGKSCTVNGCTVTVDSIINDNYTVYIRLKSAISLKTSVSERYRSQIGRITVILAAVRSWTTQTRPITSCRL